MNYKEEFSKLLFEAINNQEITKDFIKKNIVQPPNLDLGDIAFPCFSLAKELKKAPKDITDELIEKLNSKHFTFFAVNGYVNAKIKPSLLFENTVKEIITLGKEYGRVKLESKQYVIDTFQPNPLKMLHIGHIRNGVVGEAIHRLLDFINQDSKPVSYMGDIGTHIAKWMWYYKNFLKEEDKVVPKENVSKWFGNIYLKSGEKLEENEDYKEDIEKIQVDLITNKELQKELKDLVKASFDAYLVVANELDITLVDNVFESECEVKFNKKIKDDLFNKHKDVFIEDDNAIVADLKDKELGNFILIKSNGALLYGAKDIGLLDIKKDKFPNCNDFLYVVASEQDFYFKQLFKLFSLIYPDVNNYHINFGLVNTPEGKMKSREGNMILYEDFRDSLFSKVENVLKDNDLEVDAQVIKDISFGTIKFEMLKIATHKNFVFDLEKAIDLQGDSSAYVQYSGVRAKSILNKSNSLDISIDKINTNIDFEKEELILLNKLNEFKEKVIYAAKNYKPNVIANYSLELAHVFNKFYTNCQVLHSDSNIKNNRLLLVRAFLITLENALYLLGINIPKKM